MRRLYLFDQRALDRTAHLVPGQSSIDFHYIAAGRVGLAAIIHDIETHLRQSGGASGMRLICHGQPAWLQFSSDNVTPANVREFGRLRGLVRGSVQIHGCGVASSVEIRSYWVTEMNMRRERYTPGALTSWGPDPATNLTPGSSTSLDASVARIVRAGIGPRFLIAFADSIGLMVTAAIHAQFPDPSWSYEGPTITAAPGGALNLHVPPGDTTLGAISAGDYDIPR